MNTNYAPGTSPARIESGDKHEKLNLVSAAYPPHGRKGYAPCKGLTCRKKERLEPSNTADPLLLKREEVCRLLGNVSPRTVARLEQRGLIRPVSLLRHKLYSREDVLALIENLKNWEA